jgi:Mce-associated membrane protein
MSEPERPAQPAEPERPAQPAEPERPAQPAKAAKPVKSASVPAPVSARSTEPKRPAKSTEPKRPAKAAKSVTPAPVPGPQPVIAAESGAGARTTPWLSLSVGLAVVMVVVLVVVTALLSSHNHHDKTVAASSYLLGTSAKAAETAAVAEVKATLTYDYKTLDADFARAEKGLTPGFRSSYVHTTETSVRPLASKYHAISAASVAASGVSEASLNDATVLLFVDQTVQNTQLPHPRLDRSRIRVSMVRQNGQWLVNHLTPL